MKLTGINQIGDDPYFLRLKDNHEAFIHFEGENKLNTTEVIYKVELGVKGAAIFKKQQAENFIERMDSNNLEIVKVSDILGIARNVD